MPKTIVGKAEINNDPKLHIIKAFRITNKRAGEAKLRGPEGHDDYLGFCAALRSLQVQAEELGFKIWVFNGKTGHTYEKDYKETPDSWNDETTYNALVMENRAADSMETPPAEDDNIINPDMASDEDTQD